MTVRTAGVARHTISSGMAMTIPDFVPTNQLRTLIEACRHDIAGPAAPLIHHMDVEGEAIDLGRLYEPKGRTHVVASLATNRFLDRIAYASLSLLASWLPGDFVLTPWYLFSYREGQFIIPHADGAEYPTDPSRRQLAALSIWLDCPDEGGQFYVATCPFSNDWTHRDGEPLRVGLDPMSSNYDYSAAPRWHLSNFPAGSAVLFGSEVVHGTEPVIRGSALKALSFLTVKR